MTRTHRYLLGIILAAVLVWLPAAAHATPVGPDSTANSLFELDPFTVSAILGTFIPVVTGVVTKVSTSSGVKAITTAFLSGVAAVVNVSLVDGGGAVVSEDTVKAAVLTFLVAIATYYGVWKPTGVSARAQAVGNVDPG